MRARRVSIAVGAAIASIAMIGGGTVAISSAGATARHRYPAPILVYAQEWSLWPSRASLPAGKVYVQLDNRGQDAHDLRIRRLRHGQMVGRAQGVAVTQSGDLSHATWKLGPGTYELYCSLPGHLMRGMHARIVVR